jgi:hypothetical protein
MKVPSARAEATPWSTITDVGDELDHNALDVTSRVPPPWSDAVAVNIAVGAAPGAIVRL